MSSLIVGKEEGLVSDVEPGIVVDGVAVTLKLLGVKRLLVAAYQRLWHHALRVLIKRKGFRRLSLGVLYVNRRANGDLYVMDGQHRKELLLEIDGEDAVALCVVYHGLTEEQEKQMFYDLNGIRRAVGRRKLDELGAELGDPDKVAVVQVLEESGMKLTIAKHHVSDPSEVLCGGELETICARGGQDHLREVVTVVAQGFEGRKERRGAETFGGSDLFLRTYKHDPNYNRATLIERLRKTSPLKFDQYVVRNAKKGWGKRPRAAVMYAMVDAYNHFAPDGKELTDPRKP